ncbi:MAG: MgtC/SapB family protein [Erysipelotrichaceae bacterium]|nr:MgtC/SapB family protein [Erysipelotrichaceae bacterium]
MGSLIGFERHSRSKEAGVRTHAIVAMASCLLMLVSKYGFVDAARNDPARIAAQVVSGISFLGAGIIFVQKGSIQGLTTAAGIWATSAIGLCFGAGMYVLGYFAGILLFVIQMFFPKIFSFNTPRNIMKLQIYLKPQGKIADVNKYLSDMGYNHSENHIQGNGEDGWIVETEIISHKEVDPALLIKHLEENENISKAVII